MSSKILQITGLTIMAVIATSCASSNQYVSKLFAPRPILTKDSTQLAVRFLELDSINGNEDQWVKTDITKKDTTIVRDIPSAEEPVVKTSNTDNRLPIVQGTRNKKTRE
jgi:hypothetical protein